MNRAKQIAVMTASCLLAATPAAFAQGNSFPEKDKIIRVIVPFAAGGGVDGAARLLAEELHKRLGAQVIVDNKAGGNGTIGGKTVETAPADGYTLLFSAATHILAKQVLSNPPYDPQTDFAPVARMGEAPLLLVVPAQGNVRSVSELIATARQQSDTFTAAIPAAGAPSHVATLLLAKQAGIKLTYVPYKGTQPAVMDVAGGHVDMLMDSMISLLPMTKGGRVKALAISSRTRSTLAPDVPTLQEAGVPNFSYASWYGVWAPKATPPDRVEFLNRAINDATASLARAGTLKALGIEPVKETPEQFRRGIASEVTQSAELLRSAGFTPE